MKRAIVSAVFLCLSGPLAVAQQDAPSDTRPAETTTTRAADNSRILAYFGDEAITQGDIDQFIRRPTSGPAIPDEFLQRQRQQGLSQYLMRMMYDSYAADHPDLVKNEDIDAAVKKYEERIAASGRKLEDVLKQFGMTMPEFRKRLVAEVVNSKLMEKVEDDKAIADFYEKHKSDFDGTQFTAKHILILVDPFFSKPEDAENARKRLLEIKKDIESGKMTFDEAINEYSEDPSRVRGPMLPPFSRYGMMVEPFAAAAAALEPGQISDPVQSIFGYHLIQLISRTPGKAQPLDQAKPSIQNYLAGEVREKMMAEQRAKHTIKVLMPYVKPPRPPTPPRTTQPTTRSTRPTSAPTFGTPVPRPARTTTRPAAGPARGMPRKP